MIVGGIVVFIVLFIIVGISMQTSHNKPQAEAAVLKLLYTFLIGIFLAVFVGVGIAAFYPGPKFPDTPTAMKINPSEPNKDYYQSEEYRLEMEKYDKEQKDFQLQSKNYNRNVSIIALVASIVVVIASLTFFKTLLLIADGLLLGGVLTLLYSVIRGFDTDDNMFRFIVVSIGLLISLVLGYVKFIQPSKAILKK